jgi:branched-chain amino acid transport system ATP-binding protein
VTLLRCKNLGMRFGGLQAVSDFNLDLEQGELVGIIGPNGAGKTTVFNLLTGVYVPTSGTIELLDNDRQVVLNGKKPYHITQLGVARTFQNIRLFNELSVLDNVRIAYHFNVKYNLPSAILRLPSFHKEEKEVLEKAIRFLEIFGLEHRRHEMAKNLPYGEQRRLEIARALAAQPKLLLLDEPAAGMNPNETQQLMELIRWIRREFDLTILLIEHHMEVVMGVCDWIVVLDYGVTIAKGTATEIRNNPKVIEAYLGEEAVV